MGALVAPGRVRARRNSASSIPAPAWSSPDPEGNLGDNSRDRGAPRWRKGERQRPRTNRGDRHHQPARDYGSSGDRATGGKPIHNAIVWAGPSHRRYLRRRCAKAGKHEGRDSRPAPGSCSIPLLFRPRKSPWLLDHVDGRPAARPRRPAGSPSGTVDAFPALGGSPAARWHAANAPKCGTHVASSISAPANGDAELCPPVRGAVPPFAASRLRDCAGDFGVHHGRSCSAVRSASWASPAISKAANGRAGLATKPGMMKSTLRHRLLSLCSITGAAADRVQQPAPQHHRLSASPASAPTRLEGAIFVAGAAVCNGLARRAQRVIGARRPT